MSAVFTDTVLALISACQSAPALTGVTVIDGPSVSASTDKDRLFIGASLDDLAGDGDNNPSLLEGIVDAERFSIVCTAEAWTGDTDITSRRLRVFDIREAVRPLLRPNTVGITLAIPRLAWAYMGAWDLIQRQSASGAYAGLTFRVECQNRALTS